MGFLIAAARTPTPEELTNGLGGVRLLGNVRQSGSWWWTIVFYLHFKELNEALSSHESCSLSAYAGDSAWKLSLFGHKQPPFSFWFDVSLTNEHGIEKAKVYYQGKSVKLARQFGLTEEEQRLLKPLAFEEAVSRLLELQFAALLDAFQRFFIPHDPAILRDALLKPTPDELESELGNLPRFLEAIGITGLLED